MDTQVILMLASGTLLLLNGLIARGVNPEIPERMTDRLSELGSETAPAEPRETQV